MDKSQEHAVGAIFGKLALNTRRLVLATIALVCGLSCPVMAQLPSTEKIAEELAGPFQTAAAQPIKAHRGPLMRQLEPLLMQQARYLVGNLHPWPKDTAAAMLTSTSFSRENGIRPNAHTALGLAILYRIAPDEAFRPEFTRAIAREKSLALLRHLVQAHGAAGIVCDDGKPWKNQWQSAYWAYIAGEACWLLWDDLTAEQRWMAARMICDEADRFVDQVPPAQVKDDTKAEENAWNSTVISLAYNMFPHHPNHAAWKETAIRWVITSYARERDLGRGDIIDGRPVRDWLTKANIHDDYTLENHGRVHPDYMGTTILLSAQVPLYTWGGNEPPQSLHFNVEKIYASEKLISVPDGGWIYPNGQDWPLHRDWIQYHTDMVTLYHDAEAARLLRFSLSTMQRMAARDSNGGPPIMSAGETAGKSIANYFHSFQSIVLESPAQAYLLMAQFGEGPEPISEEQLWARLSGRHIFEAGKFGLLRTKQSISSFSWGSEVMGLVLPLRKDLLLTPNARGLVGTIVMDGLKTESPAVRQVEIAPFKDALGVTGVLSRGDGALEQRFGFLALPDGRTIYVDIVHLTGTAKPTVLNLGTVGVLNEKNWPHHDGTRTFAYEGGTRAFAAASAETEEAVEFSSRWFHLDGLGIVCLDTSGRQLYVPKPTGAPGRLEQLFHLNATPVSALATADKSAPIAHSVLIFYPGQSIEQTRAAAQHCLLRSKVGAEKVQLTMEDGTTIDFDLENLKISLE
jgi:hypothetical protein